jgi:hypothetical protein
MLDVLEPRAEDIAIDTLTLILTTLTAGGAKR